jgi:hypothetical protein
MNSSKQIEMTGTQFNECWFIEGLDLKDNDKMTVNFINDTIVNIFQNGEKVWSVVFIK